MERERRNFAALCSRKVRYLKSLIKMKLARFAGRVDAIVIVDAIGEIRVFLDFTYDNARADGVLGSRGYEKSIARANRVVHKQVFDGPVVDRFDELRFRNPVFEADQQFRPGLGPDDVPHFRFAAATGSLFVLRGKSIVGVHLNGKLILRKNELYEHWKVAQASQARTSPLSGHGLPSFHERMSLEGATGDAAIRCGQPGFADGFR